MLVVKMEWPFLALKPINAEADPYMVQNQSKTKNDEVSVLSKTSKLETSQDFWNHSESFKELVEMGLSSSNESVEEKLCWLRSQIIGNDAEFDSHLVEENLSMLFTLLQAAAFTTMKTLSNIIFFLSMVCYMISWLNHLDFIDLSIAGNTHTCDSYVGSRTTKMVHEAREYMKKCLGGGEDDAILFCGSGTTAAIKRLQEVSSILKFD